MNLPHYFLADLPPEGVPGPDLVDQACRALRRNREGLLATRRTRERVELLCRVGQGWLDPQNPFRRFALDQGPAHTGFSRETLEKGLNSFFQEFTPTRFQMLLEQDLGHPDRLDYFCATALEETHQRKAMAVAPGLLVQIAAGNLPNPTLMSMTLGVLAGSAQFIKCAAGTSFLPRLFGGSLYHADPKLGASLEIGEWSGAIAEQLNAVLYRNADCLTVTGSDETLAAVRAALPSHVRFLGYGHRVSFAFIGKDLLEGQGRALSPRAPRPLAPPGAFVAGSDGVDSTLAAQAAADVAAWDQAGCLSPHIFYVQSGGRTTPKDFAAQLARALSALEQSEPRGPGTSILAATIASRRSIYELRAAHSPDTQLWCSPDSTAWTVVYEADPQFQLSCLGRFIYVKPAADLSEVLKVADPYREKLSTVALGVAPHQYGPSADTLARWGVSRICPLGRMQHPPLTWRHDGRPALGDLVTWADCEDR